MENISASAQYLRWPHLSIDIGQAGLVEVLEARDIVRRVAVVMPYHVSGPSILPGTDLILTVPSRLGARLDSARTRCLTRRANSVTSRSMLSGTRASTTIRPTSGCVRSFAAPPGRCAVPRKTPRVPRNAAGRPRRGGQQCR